MIHDQPGPLSFGHAPAARSVLSVGMVRSLVVRPGQTIDISWPEMPVAVEDPVRFPCGCHARPRLVSFQGKTIAKCVALTNAENLGLFLRPERCFLQVGNAKCSRLALEQEPHVSDGQNYWLTYLVTA